MKKANFTLLTVVLLTMLAILAPSQSGGVFVMQKSSIASGGERSASGIFIVDGTIGQSFGSAVSSGGIYSETGGFWSADPIASGSPSPTPSASISGTVTYANASVPPKYISNVTVTGSGSPNVSTTTAAPGMFAGTYTLTGFGSGAYTVALSKTTGQNSITSNDAARIAQHVAGTSLLNTTQKVVADVTGNSVVSSNDAAKIAQYVAGLPFSPPNLTGTWQFYLPPGPTFPVGSSPTSRTYNSVNSSIAGDDYVGLLIGEVTGNWAPSSARPAGRQTSQGDGGIGSGSEWPIAVIAPHLAAAPGKQLIVPIAVEGIAGKGIISYQFDLRYDPSVIQPRKDIVDLADTVSRGLSFVANAEKPGILRVVVYGPMPIVSDGVLVNLRFTAVGTFGSASTLTMERLMFGEDEVGTAVTDGRVELSNE